MDERSIIVSEIIWYLDEDVIERSLIRALRNSNIDVITTAETNNLGCTDEEQLRWANENKRVIYTYNVGDFCRLHKKFTQQNISHSGILLGTQKRYSIGEQLQGILYLRSQFSAENMENKLFFLSAYIGK
jgi:Domain of unknown function (DUF5615)